MTDRDSLCIQRTPEGVEIELHSAGPVVRFIAFIIDGAIRITVLLPILIILTMTGSSGTWLIMLIIFLFEWFYFTLFEGAMDGQTPGKKVMGIRVIRDNGTALTWNAAMVRNLLRAADGFLFNYIIGFVVMFCSRGFRRIGDHAAGTMVVYTAPVVFFESGWSFNLDLRPVPPQVGLTVAEQQAILSFAERLPLLTDQRAEELAGILDNVNPAILPSMPYNAGIRLLAVAQWIKGEPEKGRFSSAGGADERIRPEKKEQADGAGHRG